MSLPPQEIKERYLPSVDRLESSLAAARASLDRGRVEEALAQIGAALRLKPEYDGAWILRGHALRQAGDLEGALQSFATALRFNREAEEAWMGFAAVLHDLGRLREEVEAYDALLKLRPRTIEAWTNKGAALHELRDFQGAIACYDRVIGLRPEHAPAWNNKGAALLRLRDESGAARCFDEALHLDPDFFDAMVNRMFLYQKQGRHGETVLWADRAIRLREAPWLWYLKGLAHFGLLESTLAMKSFERALVLDPKFRQAREALRRAKALRGKADFYRGVYECFGTHVEGDPGCAECEILSRCREVTPP